MYIKVKDLSKVLDTHPYFVKLSDGEKLKAINLARTNYHNFVNEKQTLHLIEIPDGSVGDDGEKVENLHIPELPQNNLKALGIPTYEEVLSMAGEMIQALDEDSQKLVYTIAISKIQKLQKELYEITNSSEVTNKEPSQGQCEGILSSNVGYIPVPVVSVEALGELSVSWMSAIGSSDELEAILGMSVSWGYGAVNIIEATLGLEVSFEVLGTIQEELEALAELEPGFNRPGVSVVNAEGQLEIGYSLDGLFDVNAESDLIHSYDVTAGNRSDVTVLGELEVSYDLNSAINKEIEALAGVVVSYYTSSGLPEEVEAEAETNVSHIFVVN